RFGAHEGQVGYGEVELVGIRSQIHPGQERRHVFPFFRERKGLIGFVLEGRQAVEHPGIVVPGDRKSTRLNSSHVKISYAVFCLKKKKIVHIRAGKVLKKILTIRSSHYKFYKITYLEFKLIGY